MWFSLWLPKKMTFQSQRNTLLTIKMELFLKIYLILHLEKLLLIVDALSIRHYIEHNF